MGQDEPEAKDEVNGKKRKLWKRVKSSEKEMVPIRRMALANRHILEMELRRPPRERMFIFQDKRMNAIRMASSSSKDDKAKAERIGYYCNHRKEWVWEDIAVTRYSKLECDRRTGLIR